MKLDPAIRDEVLRRSPVSAFAIRSGGNIDRADDLVQETCCARSRTSISFEPGTNMPAWLFTILRNLFRSEYRKRRREVEDADGRYAESLKIVNSQAGGCGAGIDVSERARQRLLHQIIGAMNITQRDGERAQTRHRREHLVAYGRIQFHAAVK